MSNKPKPEVTSIVITDLDGTLFDISHRLHLIDRQREGGPDWPTFHAACKDDKPIENVIHVVRQLVHIEYSSIDHMHASPVPPTLVVVSGRSKATAVRTTLQLQAQNLYPDKMYMRGFRPDGRPDTRPDTELKLEALKQIRKDYPNAEIIAVFEDRQSVVDMWREQGLTVFQVAPGDF